LAKFNIEIAIGLKGGGSREAEATFRAIGGGALNAQVRVAGLEGVVGKLRGAFLAFGGLAFLGRVIRETSEAEDSLAQLRASVISTGGAAGLTAEQLAQMASEFQNVTRYSDEAVAGAEKVLLTFRQIKGDNFRDATAAVLDMTAKLGGDLESRAKGIGKLLEGSLSGALKLGIIFTDEQKKLIKTLFDTGQAEKAQAIILKELQVAFGGSAAAARNTMGGAIDSLKNQVGELFEAIGGELSPVLVGLANDLQSAATSADFTALAREIGQDLAIAIKLVAEVSKFLISNVALLRVGFELFIAVKAAQWLYAFVVAARSAIAANGVLGIAITTRAAATEAAALAELASAQAAAAAARRVAIKTIVVGEAVLAVGAMTEAEIAAAIAITRTGTALDLTNRKLIAHDAAAAKAAAANVRLAEAQTAAGTATARAASVGGLIGPLAGLAVALAIVYAGMKLYIAAVEKAYEVQQKELANSASLFQYLDQLRQRKAALTAEEYGYADAIRKRVAVESAAANSDALKALYALNKAKRELAANGPPRPDANASLALGPLGLLALQAAQSRKASAEIDGLSSAYEDAKGHARELGQQSGLLEKELARVGHTAAKSAGDTGEFTKAQEKAREAVRKMIADLQREAAFKQKESVAAGIGPEAERAFARLKAIAEEVEKARERLADQGLTLAPKDREEIEEWTGAMFDAVEATNRARAGADALRSRLAESDVTLASLSVSFREKLGETLEQCSERIATTATEIRQLKLALNTASDGSEEYAHIQANLAEAQAKYTAALGRRVALEAQAARGVRAAVEISSKAFSNTIAKIHEEISVLGMSSDAARQWAIDHQTTAEAVRIANDNLPGENFSQRWLDAVKIAKGALLELANAEYAKQIHEHLVEPIKQAGGQMRDSLVGAFADWVTGAKVSVTDLVKSWLATWARAMAEWLLRWTAVQVKAAAVSRAAKIAGGSGGDAGGGAPAWFGSGTAGIGSASSSGGGAAAGAGAALGTVAVFAAIYLGVKSWIGTHRREWAELTIGAGSIGAVSTLGSGKSVESLGNLLSGFVDNIRAFAKEYDAQFLNLQQSITVGSNGQGKDKTYYIKMAGEIVARFGNDAQEAMEQALVLALQNSEFRGLSPLVKQALKASMAKTAEALQKEMSAFNEIANLGVPDTIVQIRQNAAHLDELRAALSTLREVTPAVTQGFADLASAEISSRLSARDAITGRQRTAAEEAQIQAAQMRAYNADLVLRRANVNVMVLEAKARLLEYQSHARLIGGGGGGGSGLGGPNGSGLSGLGRAFAYVTYIVGTAAAVITGSGDAMLDALQAQLGALEDLANSLNEIQLIDPGELIPRGGRNGGGAGSTVGDDRQQVRDFLKALDLKKLSAFGQALAELNKQFEEEIKNAHGDAQLLDELNRKRREEIALLRQQATQEMYGKIKDFEKNPFKQSGFSDAVAEVQAKADELTAEFLKNAHDMGWSAERIARGLARIDAAEERHLRFLSQQAFGELTGQLAEIITDDKLRQDLLRNQEIITFQLKMVQLRAEFELVKSLGYLTDAQVGILQEGFDWINAHADDLPGGKNWHPPGPPPPPGGDSVQELYARRLEEAAQAAREAADEFRRSTEELIRGRDSFLLGSNSPLTPAMQYEEALRQYRENLALALGGDIDARNRFNDLANQLRDVFQGAYGSQGIESLMQQVLGDYARLIGSQSGTIFGNVQVGGNFGGRGSTTGTGTGGTAPPIQPTGGNVGFSVTPIVLAIDTHRRQAAGDAAELLTELRGFRSDAQVARGGR
jgi:hypothetical protein